MGAFNAKITAEYNPPRKWIMQKPLIYDCTDLSKDELNILSDIGVKLLDGIRIAVKKGFKTDLASVPRAAWAIIAPWDVARAAIIHDLLYKRIRQYRYKMGDGQDKWLVKAAKKVADKVFLCGMKDAEPKVSGWKIYSAYYAVALFGRWSIIPNKENI